MDMEGQVLQQINGLKSRKMNAPQIKKTGTERTTTEQNWHTCLLAFTPAKHQNVFRA